MTDDTTSFMYFVGLCVVAIGNWVVFFRFSQAIKERRPNLWKEWTARDTFNGWRAAMLPLLLLKQIIVDTPLFIIRGELTPDDADEVLLKRERWARLAALVFYLYFFGVGFLVRMSSIA